MPAFDKRDYMFFDSEDNTSDEEEHTVVTNSRDLNHFINSEKSMICIDVFDTLKQKSRSMGVDLFDNCDITKFTSFLSPHIKIISYY